MAYAVRPEHVFVGNHVYRIDWLTAGEWEARNYESDADGSTYPTQKLIGVRLVDDVQESHYQEVVLHELTHAVWDSTMLAHFDLKESKDAEEFVCSAQSPALLFSLKHNPVLVKWLLSDGNQVR